jgi:hypothetical protein
MKKNISEHPEKNETKDGKQVVFGSVIFKEYIMCSSDDSVEEMTHHLDIISNLKLYHKLHTKEVTK